MRLLKPLVRASGVSLHPSLQMHGWSASDALLWNAGFEVKDISVSNLVVQYPEEYPREINSTVTYQV